MTAGCIVCLVLVSVAPAARAEVQTLVSPSAHFGASIFPEFEPMAQVGLHFDRFTEFGLMIAHPEARHA